MILLGIRSIFSRVSSKSVIFRLKPSFGRKSDVPSSSVDLGLLSVLEECEGGVALDLVVLADALGLGAVQLGDLYVLAVGEVLGQLIPGGGEFLKKKEILHERKYRVSRYEYFVLISFVCTIVDFSVNFRITKIQLRYDGKRNQKQFWVVGKLCETSKGLLNVDIA